MDVFKENFWNHSTKPGKICIAIQAVLLLFSIVLLLIFGIEDSLPIKDMSIAFDIMAALVIIIIMRSCINGKIIRSSACFINLLMTTFLCIFFESCAWIADGISGAVVLNYIGNIGSNCFMLLSAYLFYEYSCVSCEINDGRVKKNVIRVVVLLGLLAEILNVPFGYYYTVQKDGTYVRNTGIDEVFGFIPFVFIFVICCINVCKAELGVRQKMTYMSYGFIPLVVSIWYTITGYPPTFFVSLFFSLMLIYSNIYVVQGKQLQQNEIKITKQKNQMALSQIRPHFLYNALGSIEVLCKTDPQKAGQAVHFFSRYLRMNMDALGDLEMISFSKELEHIHNYVWLEKMRFEEDLEFTESIEVKDFAIPVLSVQPLVENAIKHGMMGMEEGTLHVNLSTFEKEGNIYVRIEDDGAGFDMNAPKVQTDDRSHLGLSNVKERIIMLTNGCVEVESEVGKGTRITIVLKK